MADLAALDAGAVERRLGDMGGERRGRDLGELAAEGADGGAGSVEDDDFAGHGDSMGLWLGRGITPNCWTMPGAGARPAGRGGQPASRTQTSTRRLSWRPSAVSLQPTGVSSP